MTFFVPQIRRKQKKNAEQIIYFSSPISEELREHFLIALFLL